MITENVKAIVVGSVFAAMIGVLCSCSIFRTFKPTAGSELVVPPLKYKGIEASISGIQGYVIAPGKKVIIRHTLKNTTDKPITLRDYQRNCKVFFRQGCAFAGGGPCSPTNRILKAGESITQSTVITDPTLDEQSMLHLSVKYQEDGSGHGQHIFFPRENARTLEVRIAYYNTLFELYDDEDGLSDVLATPPVILKLEL